MSLFLLAGIALTGFFAAALGTMVGLGGGVFVVPVLAVVLGVDLKAAIAASAVCVVLNSLRGGGAYLSQGLVNLKLAMILQVSTAIFAVIGGLVVIYTPVDTLRVIFGLSLLVVMIFMIFQPEAKSRVSAGPDPFKLKSSFRRPGSGERAVYIPQRVRTGMGLSGLAGMMSGMLGIGGGAVHVPIMNVLMKVPLRAAIATSTFMVGITATVSALIYAGAGLVDAAVTVPAMAGILIGSQAGSQMGSRVSVKALRWVLITILGVLAMGMIFSS